MISTLTGVNIASDMVEDRIIGYTDIGSIRAQAEESEVSDNERARINSINGHLDLLTEVFSSVREKYSADEEFIEEIKGCTESVLDDISSQEREVLERRYGLLGQDPQNYGVIAEGMKTSRAKVFRTHHKALQHLRSPDRLGQYKEIWALKDKE